jgi:hypothetical protein
MLAWRASSNYTVLPTFSSRFHQCLLRLAAICAYCGFNISLTHIPLLMALLPKQAQSQTGAKMARPLAQHRSSCLSMGVIFLRAGAAPLMEEWAQYMTSVHRLHATAGVGLSSVS